MAEAEAEATALVRLDCAFGVFFVAPPVPLTSAFSSSSALTLFVPLPLAALTAVLLSVRLGLAPSPSTSISSTARALPLPFGSGFVDAEAAGSADEAEGRAGGRPEGATGREVGPRRSIGRGPPEAEGVRAMATEVPASRPVVRPVVTEAEATKTLY